LIGHVLVLYSIHGAVGVEWSIWDIPAQRRAAFLSLIANHPEPAWNIWTVDRPTDFDFAPAWMVHRLGFCLLRPKPAFGERYGGVLIPYWFLNLAFAVVVSRWLHGAINRYRRGRQGRCTSCGYDLRATPEQCPECGLLVKPTVTGSADGGT
jgi:hypothetical protein